MIVVCHIEKWNVSDCDRVEDIPARSAIQLENWKCIKM